MINWNDYNPLTREEFDGFIKAAIPYLKDMENKNSWDFFINDMSIKLFCDMLFLEAIDLNDFEDYQEHNPKVKDMYVIYNLCLEADWTTENETFRKNRKPEIWKLVLDKVNQIADSVF